MSMGTEDIARVHYLLRIVESCAGHSGKFGSISSAAMNELTEINEGIRREAAEKAEADQAKAEAAKPRAIPSAESTDTESQIERRI